MPDSPRVELLQGTLDLLILRTLLPGPSHGHAVAKHSRGSEVRSEPRASASGQGHRSIYFLAAPKGWISASWRLSDKGKWARYYRLTASGRKHLAEEQSKWQALSRASGWF
jgi:PadR family transcriptional regulator